MAQQVAGYAYWISHLVTKNNFLVRDELPRETRRLFRELARFLLANEFDDIIQLEDGVDPSRWLGADAFKQEELDYIRNLMKRGRSRSPVRCAASVRAVPKINQVDQISQALCTSRIMPEYANTVAAKGPRMALKALQLEHMTIAQSRVWLEIAR